MSRWMKFFSCCCAVVVMGFVMGGCLDGGSKVQLADSIDGTWQSKSDDQKMVIHFVGEAKSLALGEQNLPVTLKSVDENTILVNGVQPAQTPKNWKLVRMWNSNGSDFSLALIYDGKRVEFVPAGRS